MWRRRQGRLSGCVGRWEGKCQRQHVNPATWTPMQRAPEADMHYPHTRMTNVHCLRTTTSLHLSPLSTQSSNQRTTQLGDKRTQSCVHPGTREPKCPPVRPDSNTGEAQMAGNLQSWPSGASARAAATRHEARAKRIARETSLALYDSESRAASTHRVCMALATASGDLEPGRPGRATTHGCDVDVAGARRRSPSRLRRANGIV